MAPKKPKIETPDVKPAIPTIKLTPKKPDPIPPKEVKPKTRHLTYHAFKVDSDLNLPKKINKIFSPGKIFYTVPSAVPPCQYQKSSLKNIIGVLKIKGMTSGFGEQLKDFSKKEEVKVPSIMNIDNKLGFIRLALKNFNLTPVTDSVRIFDEDEIIVAVKKKDDNKTGKVESKFSLRGNGIANDLKCSFAALKI